MIAGMENVLWLIPLAGSGSRFMGLSIVVTALLAWRRKLRVVALAFFATAFGLLRMALAMRRDLALDGWSSGDWYLWRFAFSRLLLQIKHARECTVRKVSIEAVVLIAEKNSAADRRKARAVACDQIIGKKNSDWLACGPIG
jgi:hypothetical protein